MQSTTTTPNFEMVKVEQDDLDPPPPPLILFAQRGDQGGLETHLRKLEDEEELLQRDRLGRTGLHWAADNANHPIATACCKLILERATTRRRHDLLDAKDGQGRDALVWAAARGNCELIEWLLGRGAELTSDKSGRSAMHFVTELADHPAALACARALLHSQQLSDPQLRRVFINQPEAHTDRNPLHLCTIHGNASLLECLIESGGNPLAVDSNKFSVLHHAVINAHPTLAAQCTRALLRDGLIEESLKSELLNMKEVYGRGAIHIAARRGNAEVLSALRDAGANYLLQEEESGSSALHLAASLGNEAKAAACVQALLDGLTSPESHFLVNIQNKERLTAMYLAARHRNVEACKLLLQAGSSFDKKTAHGKTPLEKVYKRIPEAITVLLDKAVETSGYANRFGAIDTYVDVNFAPILGHSSSSANLYKETEELAKIRYARWEQRRAILSHPFVKVFVWKKWEKISWIFTLARVFHMLWFVSIFVFLVMIYRVHCPYKASKSVKFSWTSLRPSSEEESNTTLKSLAECSFTPLHKTWAVANTLGLLLFAYGLLLQTQNRAHWFYKPMRRKAEPAKTKLDRYGVSFLLHHLKAFWLIVPVVSLCLVALVVVVSLPVLGWRPLEDEGQYSVVGLMGFVVWFGVYLEVGKIPVCRVYINLLWKASSTLGFAILIHLPILFGFAAVFVLLMQRMPSFSSASQAVVKVLTLMIGELDYEGLFYGDEDKTENLLFAGIEMVALAVFVVFVAVLLLNFLIGLAADEIKDFRSRAEVWHLCTQIEQISLLESFLDQRCCKNFLRKELMLMPPRRGLVRRRLEVYIPTLPKELQRAIHNLNLGTMPEEK